MHDGMEGGYNRIHVQLIYYPLPINGVHGGKAPRQHAMEATRKWPRSHSQQFAPGGVWDSRQCFLFKDSPSPSLSKREKASLNSAICSSVSWSAMVDSFLLLQYCKKAKVTLWVKSGFVLLLLWGFLALVCALWGLAELLTTANSKDLWCGGWWPVQNLAVQTFGSEEESCWAAHSRRFKSLA